MALISWHSWNHVNHGRILSCLWCELPGYQRKDLKNCLCFCHSLRVLVVLLVTWKIAFFILWGWWDLAVFESKFQSIYFRFKQILPFSMKVEPCAYLRRIKPTEIQNQVILWLCLSCTSSSNVNCSGWGKWSLQARAVKASSGFLEQH